MALTGGNPTISFSTGNTLGFAHSCGGDCSGDPIFAEILLYDRALDVEERLAVESYLSGRYFDVPEPRAASLLGLGALGLAARGRRRRAPG